MIQQKDALLAYKAIARIKRFQKNLHEVDAYNAVELCLALMTGEEPCFRDE